jgi:hypothetical protein
MSRYIYTHPREACEEEIKVIIKTFERRRFSYALLYFLVLKAVVTYIYRWLRLQMFPK